MRGADVVITSTEHQYLQETEPGLVEDQTERRSLSPHRYCRPAPADEPEEKTVDGRSVGVQMNHSQLMPFALRVSMFVNVLTGS